MDATPSQVVTKAADRSPIPARGGGAVLDYVRLLLAMAITYGVLIYAWGRTLLEGVMITGRPRSLYAVLLGAGIVAVMLLSAGLSRRWTSPNIDRWVLRGVPAIWIVAVSVATWLVAGRLLSRWIVVPLFVLGSLWVLCLGWLFYRPWPWPRRGAALLAGVLVQLLFVGLFRVDGIQGVFQVDFTWRTAPKIDHGAQLPAVLDQVVERRLVADLTRTSPHDFPQFLGPDRSGIVTGMQLASAWNTTPPREMWRMEVGAGWSGFAVVGEYAVTQEQRGSTECVVCYRLQDRQTIWIHSDPARFESNMGGVGPRATPTIVAGRVYTVGGQGLLNCLDGATGQTLWSVNILQDNGGGEIAHGVCGSPLVTGDKVIVSPTGVAGASLVAYDCQSGRRIWQAGHSSASYGSPALARLAGVAHLLLVNHDGLSACDPETGQALWDFPWSGDLHVNCSQPVVIDADAGRVFYGTGYGQGSVLLDVQRGRAGGSSVHPVWESRGKMKTKFTTAVLHGGHVYGLDDGILACLDLQTGRQVWKSGRYGHGQILLARDLLIVQAESGDVYLVRPDPAKLIELGQITALSSKTWNNPALAGDKLLVRNDREAACYQLPSGMAK